MSCRLLMPFQWHHCSTMVLNIYAKIIAQYSSLWKVTFTINGKQSNSIWWNRTQGIPQDSILGPPMFLVFIGALLCAVEKSIVLLSFLAYSQKALCRHRRKNDGKVISIVLVRAVIGTTLLIKSKFNRNPFPSRYNFRETVSDELPVS